MKKKNVLEYLTLKSFNNQDNNWIILDTKIRNLLTIDKNILAFKLNYVK